MSKRSIIFLRELTALTANHWAFFSVMPVYAEVSSLSAWAVLGWVLTGLFPVLLFWAREIVASMLLQFCMYPLFVGLIYVLPIKPAELKGVCMFFGVIYLLGSLYNSISKSDKLTKILPPFVSLGMNLLFAMFAFRKIELPSYPFILFIGMIISICFFFLAYYLDQFLRFTFTNEDTASNMPKQKIFSSGIRLSAIYLGVFSIVMLFISSFSLSDAFFDRFLRWAHEKIKQFFTWLMGRQAKSNGDPKMLDDSMLPKLPPQIDVGEPSLFQRITELLLFVAVMALLAFVAITLLYRLFMFLLSLKAVPILSEETEEEICDLDLHEDLKKSRIFDEKRSQERGSIRQRIRRLYKRKAEKSDFDRLELSFKTAREVADSQEIPDMAKIYEKARYSEFPCDQEDLRLMHQLLKRRKKV